MADRWGPPRRAGSIPDSLNRLKVQRARVRFPLWKLFGWGVGTYLNLLKGAERQRRSDVGPERGIRITSWVGTPII